ncbi:membrane protein [Bordetella bronchiseptica]|uniref:membrane protein n=1 Tax=Bordetella bronchiseptica TaxID=518 RepID=UPI000528C87D|nr:membrane protein [Bordetella bronchiseptica]
MPLSAASQHPRSPFAGAAPLAHRPLSAIAATAAGGVPQARIKRLLGELVPQLASVHEQGHICGDITVDSVGLDESGRAHLLALNGAAQGEAALPAPGYAPFELYVEDPAWPRGPWTDIYALSAVAHSLITGRRPPAAPERSVNDGYQPLAQRDLPKYDNDFLRAIDAGLAVRPQARPHTLEAFVDSLKFPEPEPPAEAMAPQPSEPPPRDEVRDEEPVRQRPAVRSILFAILLALATLGVAVYWWQRLTGTPSGVITSSERVTTPGATATPSDSREAEPPAAGTAPPQGGDAGSADTSGAAPPAQAQAGPDAAPAPDVAPEDAATDAQAESEAAATPAPAVARVTVRINVQPWGEIWINGVRRGVSPPMKELRLAPGRYSVVVRNADLPPYRATLEVKAGQPARITHVFQ